MHRVFSVCFLTFFLFFFSSRPAGGNFGANSNAAQKSPRRNFGASANTGGLLTTSRGYYACFSYFQTCCMFIRTIRTYYARFEYYRTCYCLYILYIYVMHIFDIIVHVVRIIRVTRIMRVIVHAYCAYHTYYCRYSHALYVIYLSFPAACLEQYILLQL